MPDTKRVNEAKNMALIINLSLKVSKELSIEFLLLEMEEWWEKFPLYIVSYRDTHKLNSTEELFTTIEDDNVILLSIKSSDHYSSFKLNVGIQETKLSSIEEIIEEMLTVQQKWLYLESILVESGDIAEKLPKELDRFKEVNKAFKKIMKQASLEKKSNLF